MIEIVQTDEYVKLFDKLKDRTAKARIDIRIRRGHLVILETLNQWGRACRNYAFRMDLAIECILRKNTND